MSQKINQEDISIVLLLGELNQERKDELLQKQMMTFLSKKYIREKPQRNLRFFFDISRYPDNTRNIFLMQLYVIVVLFHLRMLFDLEPHSLD